ncbi:hypothetical protein EOD42_15695 [Rhodovarius crocodyli]|uniref:DUF4398 domain-containing protein n=1 Tax=Rhodovarius crocodyli TaxID=1979269 RepID=A0A437MDB3_9PROT|nr:hypothetical protein [Rhodovarius crocodyli]RVT95642.1 hypothetical protein EOD42_15695 [Rhodovarius crocodyli]
MRATALLLSLAVLAGPAAAHHGRGHPEQVAQVDGAVREQDRARANPAATPWVPEQNRAAAEAEAAGVDDAAGLLRSAHAALTARRAGQAIEFLERAESRLLTRSTPATRAGEPVQNGPVARITAARLAAGRGDLKTAMDQTDLALAALDRPRRRGRR